MNIGILGAGAIGGYLGIKLAAAGETVQLIGRQRLVSARAAGPLEAVDLQGDAVSALPEVSPDPSRLEDVELCLVAVKSSDLELAASALRAHLPEGALVVSLQNGLFAAQRLRAAGLRQPVVSGLVVFNVVWSGSSFRQKTSGPVAVGVGDDRIDRLAQAFLRTGQECVISKNIDAMLAGKLLLNANNGLCALTGLGLRAFLEARPARRALSEVMKEGLQVFRRARRPVAGFGRIDPRLVARVLPLPDPIFFRLAKSMITIDPTAKTSTLQDLERGRPTEIDALAGAVVQVAALAGLRAPMNAWVVNQVHRLERGEGAHLTPEELLAGVRAAA